DVVPGLARLHHLPIDLAEELRLLTAPGQVVVRLPLEIFRALEARHLREVLIAPEINGVAILPEDELGDVVHHELQQLGGGPGVSRGGRFAHRLPPLVDGRERVKRTPPPPLRALATRSTCSSIAARRSLLVDRCSSIAARRSLLVDRGQPPLVAARP